MAAKAFKLVHQKSVLRSRVFEVRAQKWRAPDGSTFERHTIVHPGAVAILPLDERGRVVMLRQFRPAANDWLLEIPAGTLEKGEAPLTCAKRELIEETGFAARKWRRLGAVFAAPGFCTELIHLFCAWDLSPKFAEKDEDEHIEVVHMSLEALGKAARKNTIRDAKTMSALLLLGLS
jgi:ADP-ribose pyrophosphatase